MLAVTAVERVLASHDGSCSETHEKTVRVGCYGLWRDARRAYVAPREY